MHTIRFFIALSCIAFLVSCATQKHARQSILDQDELLNSAHVGIKIVDMDANKVLYTKNANQYFIPASNTKLLTTYAAMELFGDSIAGWMVTADADAIYVEPNGDPTFLNDEFKDQKLFDILKKTNKTVHVILPSNQSVARFGLGWSWGTWQQTYSPERSKMPIYGNMVRFYRHGDQMKAIPSYFNAGIRQPNAEMLAGTTSVLRDEQTNAFRVVKNTATRWIRPFTQVGNDTLSYELLRDTLLAAHPNAKIKLLTKRPDHIVMKPFYTIATDTLLSIMMKRSDNFFAEQILLMSGRTKFDEFNEDKTRKYVLDSLLKGEMAHGKWSDGSGLSRSNLISADEFIALLQKVYRDKKDFERLKEIMPSGNMGTLKGLYVGYEKNIAAKTGTLTDHLALSGYIKTKRGKNVAFSFLINNHRGNANDFRQRIAQYLTHVIETY